MLLSTYISKHWGYKSRAEAWIVLARLPRWRSARLFSVSKRASERAALESPKRRVCALARNARRQKAQGDTNVVVVQTRGRRRERGGQEQLAQRARREES